MQYLQHTVQNEHFPGEFRGRRTGTRSSGSEGAGSESDDLPATICHTQSLPLHTRVHTRSMTTGIYYPSAFYHTSGGAGGGRGGRGRGFSDPCLLSYSIQVHKFLIDFFLVREFAAVAVDYHLKYHVNTMTSTMCIIHKRS